MAEKRASDLSLFESFRCFVLAVKTLSDILSAFRFRRIQPRMRKTHFISLPGQVPLFSLLLLIVSQKPVAAAIRYVNRQAAGTNSGESWTNAFTEVRSALLASSDRDEIWIASGTYYPDYNTFTKQHTGDRGMRFRLNPGVAMYGGFAGGETSRGHRDWIANPVIFSGDI